jgi:hypothetical protein
MNHLILAARILIASTRAAPSTADVLWDQVHIALLQGRWVDARTGLDSLLADHQGEARDHLPALAALPAQPPEAYRQVLQDRLQLWGAAVDRR